MTYISKLSFLSEMLNIWLLNSSSMIRRRYMWLISSYLYRQQSFLRTCHLTSLKPISLLIFSGLFYWGQFSLEALFDTTVVSGWPWTREHVRSAGHVKSKECLNAFLPPRSNLDSRPTPFAYNLSAVIHSFINNASQVDYGNDISAACLVH